MEMYLNNDKDSFKMRHPRTMIGYTHHHITHHKSEDGIRGYSHEIRVKVI